ncbi:MAG: AAA family ATPase, partial [Pseudomonadota bacterium]
MSTLHLTDLTLARFRSHARARLSVDARPVAIYGPNGAGKTSLIEAVSLLSPGRGLRRASADDMAQRPDPVGWKIGAVLSSLGQLHEVSTSSENGAARTVRIDDKTAVQTALGRICRVLWLIPSMDRLWIEGAEGRRRFLDRMTLSFEPGHAQLTLDYEKAMRERNRLLKDMVRDPAWYRVLNTQMAEAGAAMHRNRLAALADIEAAQAGAQTDFPAADLVLTHPQPACDDPSDPDALRTALEDSQARDIAAGRTLIGPHRADLIGTYAAKGLPAKDCS